MYGGEDGQGKSHDPNVMNKFFWGDDFSYSMF
jgi:hypothetical protein